MSSMISRRCRSLLVVTRRISTNLNGAATDTIATSCSTEIFTTKKAGANTKSGTPILMSTCRTTVMEFMELDGCPHPEVFQSIYLEKGSQFPFCLVRVAKPSDGVEIPFASLKTCFSHDLNFPLYYDNYDNKATLNLN